MTSAVICVIVAVVLVAKTSGEGCCTPDQWEGLEASQTGFYRDGGKPRDGNTGVDQFEVHDDAGFDMGLDDKPGRRPKSGFFVTSRSIYYDFTNTQLARFTNVTYSGKSRSYFILQKYTNGKGMLYVVDLTSNKCYTKAATGPFFKACIPDSAKAFPDTYFGVGDNKLDVRIYAMSARGKGFGVDITATVTVNGCIPVAQNFVGVDRGVKFMSTAGFVNIVGGISDPSIFNVPAACSNSSVPFKNEFDWLLPTKYSSFQVI